MKDVAEKERICILDIEMEVRNGLGFSLPLLSPPCGVMIVSNPWGKIGREASQAY